MNTVVATSGRQTGYFDRGSLRKWKVTMKTLDTQARNFGSTFGRIVMAVVCTLMIGGIFSAPAFADENYDKHHDNGKHKGYQKQSRHYYPPPPRRYYYNPPPPVYYAPAPYQSPGISIVFPLY
jgi:hypothetical protein